MSEQIEQGGEDPADTAARRAAWESRVIVPLPLTVEELYDILVAKAVVSADDRPRPQPTR